MFSALIAAFARRRARSRAIAALRGYDDHRLRDIGISRDQIDSFVGGRF